MFNLDWYVILFLAAVAAFWLYTLKLIYDWWFHGRNLQPSRTADPPPPSADP